MNRTRLLVISIAGVIALSLVAGVVAQRSSSASKEPVAESQWEYLVVAGGSTNLSAEGLGGTTRMRKQPDDSFAQEGYALERNMDKLGMQGWQLVAVHGMPNSPSYYFKRPKLRH